MPVTADDYEWVDHTEMGEAYCATLVRGTTPEGFLRAMRAEPEGELRGLAELERRTWECWSEHDDSRLLIGATAVPGDQGEWVLGLEINGYLGLQEDLVGPLSRGARVVVHFCNVNAVDRFVWWEDGESRTSFEPLFPDQRSGTAPDELVPMMSDVGFDLREERDDVEFEPTAAAFALAERLTGVHLTADLLDNATFTTGLVPRNAF